MPARSNDFQRLIFLIQKQLANSSLVVVTESRMLRDRRDGKEREVDVVVEFTQHGAPFILSIECRDTSRKVTVEHVEQLLKKHEARSDKLIIVSRSGFTKNAGELAAQYRVEAVTLQSAVDVDWSAYVERFDNLRLGIFRLRVDHHNVDYMRPAGQLALLDLSRPATFATKSSQASVRQYMDQLLLDQRVRNPVLDAWFQQPVEDRKDSFSFSLEYKPTEQLVIIQDGAVFPVAAIRANVSATVETAPLVLSPISFMKNNLLHGTASMPGSGSGKSIQLVIAPTAEPGVADVSMLFSPEGGGGAEVAKGRLNQREVKT